MLLDSVRLSRLQNYRQAKEIHDSIVPYRSGSERGRRPLGANRRYKECLIEHEKKEGSEGVVRALYYNQPLLKFFENGNIEVFLNWDSASSRQFIRGASLFDTKVILGTTYICTPTGKDYEVKDASKSVLIFDKNYECLNPEPQYRYVVDRNKLKEVKNTYRAFIEYVSNMAAIATHIPDKDLHAIAEASVWWQDGVGEKRIKRITLPTTRPIFAKDTRELIRACLVNWQDMGEKNNLEHMYVEYARLLVSACDYSWRDSAYGNGENTRQRMLNFIDEMIKYHHAQEIFIREEVEVGRSINNANRKYFK